MIEWRRLAGYRTGSQTCPDSAVTFELVLFEGASDVLFNYADTLFGSSWLLPIGGDRRCRVSR